MDERTPVDRFIVPVRSGRAWQVDAGHLCRIVVIEGLQVADFTVWNRHNPREHFWGGRSKQLQRAHVTTYDRLWSCLPYLRPMFTITNETVKYGLDEDGAGCHDLLGAWCDLYVNKLLTGVDGFDFFCHSNIDGPSFCQAVSGEARRLLRVFRRNRFVVRVVDVPVWRRNSHAPGP